MKIRKAKKTDIKQYVNLVLKSNKEYQRVISKKINFTRKDIIKDFEEFINSRDKTILIVEDNKKIIGYLVASIFISSYQRIGFIDFLFVSNKFRKKGIAKSLIKEFTIILKKKRIKRINLGVNPKNKKAINFYKILGFKLNKYEFGKDI